MGHTHNHRERVRADTARRAAQFRIALAFTGRKPKLATEVDEHAQKRVALGVVDPQSGAARPTQTETIETTSTPSGVVVASTRPRPEPCCPAPCRRAG